MDKAKRREKFAILLCFSLAVTFVPVIIALMRWAIEGDQPGVASLFGKGQIILSAVALSAGGIAEAGLADTTKKDLKGWHIGLAFIVALAGFSLYSVNSSAIKAVSDSMQSGSIMHENTINNRESVVGWVSVVIFASAVAVRIACINLASKTISAESTESAGGR